MIIDRLTVRPLVGTYAKARSWIMASGNPADSGLDHLMFRESARIWRIVQYFNAAEPNSLCSGQVIAAIALKEVALGIRVKRRWHDHCASSSQIR